MPRSHFRISDADAKAFGFTTACRVLIAALALTFIGAASAAVAEERYRVKRIPDTWEISASEDSIYFDLGSSMIDDAASQVIQRHVAKLRSTPDLQVVVIAHTDDLGSASMELAKGQERLDAVRKRLEESKVVSGRIRTENHGHESKSPQPCADEDCRRQKRRVDFLFRR